MPVTANILVLSDELAEKIHDCFKDENVALTKTSLMNSDAIASEITDFDLIIISKESK